MNFAERCSGPMHDAMTLGWITISEESQQMVPYYDLRGVDSDKRSVSGKEFYPGTAFGIGSRHFVHSRAN